MVLTTIIVTQLWICNFAQAQQLNVYIESTGGKVEFCANHTFSLTGVVFDGSGNYIEQNWVDSSGIIVKSINNIAIIKTNKPGIYSISYHVKDDSGATATAAIKIKINSSPVSEIIVVDDFLRLTNISGDSNYKYRWFKNGVKIDNSDKIDTSEKSEYKVVITDENGCTFTATKNI